MQKETSPLFHLTTLFLVIFSLFGVGIWIHYTYELVIFKRVAIHAVVETAGAILSLSLSFFLLQFNNTNSSLNRFHFASFGLIVMAIFDLFHAVTDTATLFVWFHTIGVVIASILFLAVYLPERKITSFHYTDTLLPLVTIGVSAIFALSLSYQNWFLPPELDVNDHFTVYISYLHIFSSLLLLLVSLSFALRYWKDQDKGDLYFFALTLLLAYSSFLFQFSQVWGITWWYSHLLRVGAFFLLLLYFLNTLADKKQEEEEISAINTKLVEKTAALQDAYDEMEAFTYSVSHDLRSPLRATDGFSQALLEDYTDQLDATAQDYLTRIRLASQKMGTLIDDLLQLSRQTRTEMVPKWIDLGAIARSITTDFQQQYPERNIEIVIADDLLAYADTNLMTIALNNLLNNAWKYTSHHSSAKIEFGSMIKNGEKIFYIRDNGAGFEMAYVDKLFKPFQRLHAAQEFAGNGIGLAMVYRIVKRHLGRIWAESEIEKGATFFFTMGMSEPYQNTKEQS